MLVQRLESIQKTSTSFVHPQYGKNCISAIPNTILHLFGATNQKIRLPLEGSAVHDKINKVVLVIIDGFGFNKFLNYHSGDRFLNSLIDKGEVYPLTSVFPSQTTNALTTLNTALTPQEHGLFEYFIYLKEVGVINAMQFQRLSAKNQKGLTAEGFDPSIMLLKKQTIHNTLKDKGVKSFAHLRASNAVNACSKLIFQGSKIVPATNAYESIVSLRKNLQKNSGESAYFFLHLDTLDTVSHDYGPGSFEYYAELSLLTRLLYRELVQKTDAKTAKETLLLVTADHGGVDVNPNETTYINLLPKLLNFQVGKNRKPILPLGSPREIFLHIKERKLVETKQWLIQKIGHKAKIIETREVAEKGLFGLDPARTEILERTGNLMILPYGDQTVWFENPEGRKISYLGQHGGLSEKEMLVPFAVAQLNSLKDSVQKNCAPVPTATN
jgi:predicted AlkP superfamily pyrophosphatase or phosphodiesterase